MLVFRSAPVARRQGHIRTRQLPFWPSCLEWIGKEGAIKYNCSQSHSLKYHLYLIIPKFSSPALRLMSCYLRARFTWMSNSCLKFKLGFLFSSPKICSSAVFHILANTPPLSCSSKIIDYSLITHIYPWAGYVKITYEHIQNLSLPPFLSPLLPS